jgi:hypothetical protein
MNASSLFSLLNQIVIFSFGEKCFPFRPLLLDVEGVEVAWKPD